MTYYDEARLIKCAQMMRLAPLNLKPGDPEISKYLSFLDRNTFNDVIHMIEEDQNVDTSCVDENILYFNDVPTKMREDKEFMRNNKADIMKNSKNNNGDYYVVPKVIE